MSELERAVETVVGHFPGVRPGEEAVLTRVLEADRFVLDA